MIINAVIVLSTMMIMILQSLQQNGKNVHMLSNIPAAICASTFVSHPQTSLQAATSRRICHAAPLCAKQAKTAVTWWQAVGVAHTPDSMTASVRKDTTARVCSTNAQVGYFQSTVIISVFQVLLLIKLSLIGSYMSFQRTINNLEVLVSLFLILQVFILCQITYELAKF